MGCLKSIKLHNFKSYEGQTEIPIGDAPFTSIVGPNGSGKSNLMDAISFALGLDLSLIRVNQPKDLVSEGVRSSNTYVELDFRCNDGSTAKFRSSIRNNACHFYVNGKELDHEAYKKVLASHNILVDAQNFLVFQNDVERVANGSPKDTAMLIERVSGSVEFKAEYELAKKKMERAKRAATSAFAVRRDLKAEIQQYTEQERTKAEFDKLKAELKQNRVDLVTKRLKVHDLKRVEADNVYNEMSKRLDESKKAADGAKKGYDEMSKQYAKARREAVRYEAVQTERFDKVKSLNEEYDSITRKTALAKSDVQTWESKIEYSTKQLEQATAELKQAEKDIRVIERAEQEFEAKYGKESSSIASLSPELQQEFLTLKQQFLQQTNQDRQELDQVTRELNMKHDVESLAQDDFIAAKTRVEKLQEARELVEIERAQLEALINERKTMLADKKQELEETGSALREAGQKIELDKKTLAKASSDLRQSDGSIEHAKVRHEFLEAISRLKRKFPGVIDVLPNLVEPKERRFSRAVDRVLGSHFDSVVVNNFATASKCIDFLTKEQLGHMTFLPIDDLKVGAVDSMLRSVHPNARLAIDTVQYSDKARLAVAFVCGETLICDDLDVALNLRKHKNIKSRLVTVDGSLLHGTGAITGGVMQETNRYDERKLVSLQRKIETLVDEIKSESKRMADLQFQEESLATDHGKLAQLIKFKEESLDTINKKLESMQREIDHLQRETIEPKQRELAAVQNAIAEMSSQQQAVQDRLVDAKSEIYADFCSKTGLDIDNYERNFTAETRRRRELAKQRMRLEQVERLAKSHFDEADARVKDHKARHSGFLEYLKTLDVRLAEVEQERDQALAEFDEIKGSMDTAIKKAEELNEELFVKESSKDDLAEIYQEEMSRFEEYEESRNLLDEQRKHILRDAQFNGIEISANQHKRTTTPEEGLIDLEAGMISLETTIRELQDRLESMVINTNAIDYLEQAKEQLEAANADLAAKRRLSEEASREFDGIKTQRRNKFNLAFEHVRTQISEVYRELTKTRHQPMGGAANLVLINEEEPYLEGIEYTIMPPSKRFCELSQLSGGERTVAALALLFAIQTYEPAPFFILDEVDSALDYVNVALLGQYLERHAGPDFQFIVISFKLQLYSQADSLIGVYKNPQECRSQVLSYRLPEEPVSTAELVGRTAATTLAASDD